MSAVKLAVQKPLPYLNAADEALLFDRGRATDPAVERAVAAIVADVRDRGDAALREMARRFDGVDLVALEVPSEAGAAALAALDPAVRAALEQAADAIAAFHRAQLPPPLEVELRAGIRLGRRAEPLRRVGVYAPGGRAAYPSSVLMGVVPARVAGVDEIVVCSPPGPDGLPPAEVLAACVIAKADRVFAIGGAGAVTAMAFGTESVPRVDKIVGPGNAYVTEAKRQLTGTVAIDCPAGPSEILVIADESANPVWVALELIAQAEHDPDAAAVLVALDDTVADAVAAALARLLPAQPRRDIVEAALAARGAILVAPSLGDALRFAERYAPEHLALMIEEPRRALDRVRAAGTVFLGASSSVAFGDYLTGANHVLPTAGLARAWSGLSTLDFLRFSTYQEVTPEAAAYLAPRTATLADAEGLPGHAATARARAGDAAATAATSTVDSGPVALPFRAAYRDVELYDPGRRTIDVDLSDNTNLFGAPPAAARALAALQGAGITRYPPVFADDLKSRLAALHGVEPENIATGCGADDVIDSAIRAFCEPGDTLAHPDPTFGMVALFARMNAVRPRAVTLAATDRLDVDGLLRTRARLTYVCQPNNPTGALFDPDDIRRLGAETPGILMVDEAYADYAGVSMATWAARSERVVVLRTFSKAFGLAGLRVGYAIGPATLIREIEKSRGPYKITAAADAAARAVLSEDLEWVRACVAQTIENRERLTRELLAMGVRAFPSAANFVLLQAPDDTPGDASRPAAFRLGEALRLRGVAVRAFPALPIVGDCVRVTVGPWEMMERFLGALREVVEGGGSGDAGPRAPAKPPRTADSPDAARKEVDR